MTDYSRLVTDHHAALYRIAYGILRDPASSEDAVQEVYLDLLRRSQDIAKAEHPRAFLARCVIHRALMIRRADSRRDRREAKSSREVTVDPVRDVGRREIRSQVQALPEDERVAVDLHYLQGFSLVEVSSALAVSDRTVSTRLRAGLDRLKKVLGAAGFVALLASLESELRACEPVPVPAGLERRLQALRLPKGSGFGVFASRRFLAIPILVAMCLLVFFVRDRFDRAGTAETGGTATGGVPMLASGPVAPPATTIVTSVPLDPAGSVRGVVVFENGAPVAGASVRIDLCPGSLINATGGWNGYGGTSPGAATVTDANGRFGVPVAHGHVDVIVKPAGRVPIVVRGCSTGDDLRIVVPEGRIVRVHVATEDGKPVAQARLVLNPNVYERSTVDLKETYRATVDKAGEALFQAEATTDSDGRATFAGVPRRRPLMVHVLHPEFIETDGYLGQDAGDGQTVEIVARPGMILEGKVLDAAGVPVAGAVIHQTAVRSDGKELELAYGFETTSGADGTFRFRNWHNAWVLLWCHAAGFTPVALKFHDSPAEIRLERGLSVRGRVVDRSGEPFPGAVVGAGVIEDKGLSPFSPVRTDLEGHFTLADLPRGKAIRIEAATPGGCAVIREIAAPATDSIDAGDFVLVPGAALVGTVTCEDGTPCERLRMQLKSSLGAINGLPTEGRPSDLTEVTREVMTDAFGKYRFPDLLPGTYSLQYRPAGWQDQERSVEIGPGATEETVNIVLDAGWALEIVAVDDAGKAVEGLDLEACSDDGTVWGTTDATGLVSLRPTADTVHVSITGSDVEEYPDFQRVEVQRGSGRLRLAVPAEHHISGHVLFADGTPASETWVKVSLPGEDSPGYDLSDRTDDDGAFNIRLHAAGPVDLEAELFYEPPKVAREGDRRYSYTVKVRVAGVAPGTKDVELRAPELAQDGVVTIRVESPEGAPWPNALVGIDGNLHDSYSGMIAEVHTDELGEARIDNLPKRRFRVWTHPEDAPPEIGNAASVEFTPDGQTITLRLRKHVRVAGRVIDEADEPQAGVNVEVFEGEEEINSEKTAVDGTFEVWIPEETKHPTLRAGIEETNTELARVEEIDPRVVLTVRVKTRK